MSVHYRFKSALEYDTITFDGIHISVKDLKNSIMQQKRIGKSTDFDLRITNAQTEEIYDDDTTLIPKNTSLLIARIPIITPKQKQWEGYGNDTPASKVDDGSAISKTMDLANLDAPEDDKIRAMMSQSTQDYDPSNYVKIRGANQVGPVPASYRCYKCHQSGHWIKDCPLGQGAEPIEIKKSTGIPHSFLVPVEGPQVPGAMMMSNGQYAVPALDLQAYQQQKLPAATSAPEPKTEIPEDLLCSICSDLLADAVMIPCCGNSFCDECIRSILLESEEHECPDCHEKDISPATLIPNRFLRKSVANFKNTTGYEKKPVFRPKLDVPKEEPPKKLQIASSTDVKDNLKKEEKTVISEADSTEHAKNETAVSKEIEPNPPQTTEPGEGPPGVSPKELPDQKIINIPITPIENKEKERLSQTQPEVKKSPPRRSRSSSPRRTRNRRSPSYDRRSPATPTRDDFPPNINTFPPPTSNIYGTLTSEIMPMSAGMPQTAPGMQTMPPVGIPGGFAPGQPPPFHPAGIPPNFRLPPPGTHPPPYMPPGSYANRPMYDAMTAPPYAHGYPGRSSRDYSGRRGRERTPPGVIDDPLAAFNRIIREKDEKRARMRMSRPARRSSYSRSRSRSRSYSRSPPPLRRRSRSPRRRISRSRSRSFSMSRSRSRSFSPRIRGSPLPILRRSSPPQGRGGPSGRFRSPHRSPPRRRIERDRLEFDRDYERGVGGGGGGYRDRSSRQRRADSRDRFYDDRDFDRNNSNRNNNRPSIIQNTLPSLQQPPPQWGGPPPRDQYYPDQTGPSGYPSNRYPQQIHHIPSERKYEQGIAPPGVEQPPIPGLESELPPTLPDFEKERRILSPPPSRRDKYNSPREHEQRDRRELRDIKKRSKSKSIERHRHHSPKSHQDSEKFRKIHSSSIIDFKDDRRKDKQHVEADEKKLKHNKDHSDEEKKKNKEKKKDKDKKHDKEKKKKKDKKEKHHKSKERKEKKEEFKQVIIPKASENAVEMQNNSVEMRNKIDEIRKQKEDDDLKKRFEEDLEEKRLKFIEDEKRKNDDENQMREEVKKIAFEDVFKAFEEEEERRKLEAQHDAAANSTTDLYDTVISEKDLATEINSNFKSTFVEIKPNNDEIIPEEFINPINTSSAESEEFKNKDPPPVLSSSSINNDGDDEDAGILELHSDIMDIKLDDSDIILPPAPEKSKWDLDEVDEQISDAAIEKSMQNKETGDLLKGKVSNEVLKRAENVIFARAINSIRPSLDGKKTSAERGKEIIEEPPSSSSKKIESVVEKPRVSVKERLGIKVDDPDPKSSIILGGGSRHSISPFSRKERRVEIESHNRRHEYDYRRGGFRTRERSKDRRRVIDRNSEIKKSSKREDFRNNKPEVLIKMKRTRSRSDSLDHKKKKRAEKEKKMKKETKISSKKHDEASSEKKDDKIEEIKQKSAVEKRKPTLDEANFEPDYDLDVHEDETAAEKKKEIIQNVNKKSDDSSSSESSSSSDEDKKKRKRKSKKRKKRKESSSSDSETTSDSSDTDKERKKKKSKKSKKKKKKSKHK